MSKRKASSELPDDSENSHILKVQRVEHDDQDRVEEALSQDKKDLTE